MFPAVILCILDISNCQVCTLFCSLFTTPYYPYTSAVVHSRRHGSYRGSKLSVYTPFFMWCLRTDYRLPAFRHAGLTAHFSPCGLRVRLSRFTLIFPASVYAMPPGRDPPPPWRFPLPTLTVYRYTAIKSNVVPKSGAFFFSSYNKIFSPGISPENITGEYPGEDIPRGRVSPGGYPPEPARSNHPPQHPKNKKSHSA